MQGDSFLQALRVLEVVAEVSKPRGEGLARRAGAQTFPREQFQSMQRSPDHGAFVSAGLDLRGEAARTLLSAGGP